MQVQRKYMFTAVSEEGRVTVFSVPLCRLAPYRGWFPVICSLCCSNFVYFYCFHSLKASWLKGKQSAPSTDLLIGIAAGQRVTLFIKALF